MEKTSKKAYEWGDKDLAKKNGNRSVVETWKTRHAALHMLQYSEYHEDFGSCAEIQIIFGTVRESKSACRDIKLKKLKLKVAISTKKK